ncbi:hypothetical protein DFQ28_008376, partial [Apophysomyces sp. BC1034]
KYMTFLPWRNSKFRKTLYLIKKAAPLTKMTRPTNSPLLACKSYAGLFPAIQHTRIPRRN